ncbi:hypothetical protein [Scytonema sp. NUACC26]|uniref:hypothetical protein n=1 Tax=Scytonema sp. NUACC26 TaxID=3140176 RepID=UPI0034DC9543
MTRVRWYKGYKYKGNPKELVEQISKKVQEHYVSQYIPLLRIEKGAKSRKEFYFFLAIESEQIGAIPPDVNTSNLLQLPFFKFPAVRGDFNFTYEQIKPMVGATHDVHDYTNPIPYQLIQKVIYEHPFDFTPLSPANDVLLVEIQSLSHCYEQLLYWLSAFGSGTWESFKKACDVLNLKEPKKILRRLRLLGHIETSLNGLRWSTAPTTLVKIASKSDCQKFILCGQRNINLLRLLEQYTKLEFSNQATGEAPPCVYLQLNDPAIFFNLLQHNSSGYSLTNVGEVSKHLASILPTLEAWKQSLRNLQGIVPSFYEWKYFDRNNFVECLFPTETGMYQMWKQGISTRPFYTLFYDRESDSWLQGDWYGLRFLSLQYNGQECIVYYDVNTERLAVPILQRWPEIYERVLVLASGKLPIFQSSYLLYDNVQLEVVCQLSNKLNVKVSKEFTYA